ncbi:uncharacterized protein si:ch211-195m9.3 [Engraulis encrasicolus]|uniref:uncharacterized protein si:ch211-195m9.3 n=1 Tax=Engraulis encrasicolus TaxID=184585 RepID=UPI002FD23076
MGSKMALSFASLYCGLFEQQYIWDECNPHLQHITNWKRYIDDVFFIWQGVQGDTSIGSSSSSTSQGLMHCGKHETLFCGPHNHKVAWPKLSPDHICCGNQTYNKSKQCCCFHRPLMDMGCKTHPRVEPLPLDVRRRRRSVVEEARCGLARYNTVTHICCVDQLFQRPTNGQTECCGRVQYSNVTHRCCNGVLHEAADSPLGCTRHQPLRHTSAQSGPCSGTSSGSSMHRPHGAHCCGQHEYDPVEQICCSGCSHRRSPATSCCGADAFSPWSDLTTSSCSRATRAMQRSPTASAECDSGFQRRLLNHWKKEDVCCQVFLGTVESVAKTTQELTIVMAHILRVSQSSQVTSEPHPRPLRMSLHCDPTPMRPGEAYLWTEGDNCPARLVSNITGLSSPVHALLSRRQSLNCASEEDIS